MAGIDKTYHQLCKSILDHGYWYTDRSRNVRCKQLSSCVMEIPLHNNDFPLITTKKMFTKGIVGELIWFLRGNNNIKYLIDNGINIWNQDAYNYYKNKYAINESDNFKDFVTFIDYIKEGIKWDEELRDGYEFGDVGRNYGMQWRNWRGASDVYDGLNFNSIDQITNLIKNLKDNPINRRNIVTAWNPAELNLTALPPCHWSFEIIPRPLYQFEKEEWNTEAEYAFILKWHQRSVDVFLGLPFNIASYALLAKIIEKITGYICIQIAADLSNIHIYENHIDAVKAQLHNNVIKYSGCSIEFVEESNKLFEIFKQDNWNFDDFICNFDIHHVVFNNYNSYDKINSEIIVPQ